MRRLLCSTLVLAGLLTLWVTSAQAGAPTDLVRQSVGQLVKVLDDPALKPEKKAKARQAAIREVTGGTFDFAESAKRALARHWWTLTDRQREEFVKLFRDRLEHSYLSNLEPYAGEKVGYTSETIDGEHATVQTRILPRKGPSIRVDYRMLKRDDRWRVYDVAFDGASLVAHHRTVFTRIVQTSSYGELVKRMKTEQELAAREPATASWIARVLGLVGLLASQQLKGRGGTTTSPGGAGDAIAVTEVTSADAGKASAGVGVNGRGGRSQDLP